jgi:hypothetical protein
MPAFERAHADDQRPGQPAKHLIEPIRPGRYHGGEQETGLSTGVSQDPYRIRMSMSIVHDYCSRQHQKQVVMKVSQRRALGVLITSVVNAGADLIMAKVPVCGGGVESSPHGGLRVPP